VYCNRPCLFVCLFVYNHHVPYLSASAVVIHYEEALYQVYGPLPFTLLFVGSPYYSQRVVFASPLSAFSFTLFC